jgi:hypothetical protein
MAEQRSRSRKPGPKARAGEPGPEGLEPSGAAACPVAFCPVGLAMTLTDQIRPEVVEHLMAAGRELLLAMKAVIDARVEGYERSSPLERITIE